MAASWAVDFLSAFGFIYQWNRIARLTMVRANPETMAQTSKRTSDAAFKAGKPTHTLEREPFSRSCQAITYQNGGPLKTPLQLAITPRNYRYNVTSELRFGTSTVVIARQWLSVLPLVPSWDEISSWHPSSIQQTQQQ